MGAFGGLIQTNKGRNLQAKAETGVELRFTKMGVGDGQLAGQSIPSLTRLISEKKSLPITRLKTQLPAQAIVGAVLSNQDVTTGFYFREIGIFAQDPDEGEILYAYGNSGSGAEYIPPAGTADIIEKTIDMIVTFGQAQNVSAVINSSLVYVTHEELAAALEGLDPDIPLASLTQPGITQLSNAINSTSDTFAATPSAVKKAYDRADQAFTAGNERKAEVVAALVAIGVQASTSETWAQLIPKIAAVIRATGNATAADVLAGKTFSNVSANGLSGTMIKRTGEHAAVDYLYYPQNNNLYIKPPVGFYKGGTKGNWDSDANVFINEPKLIPANIPKDTTILGVLGVLERMTTAEKQAIANAITGKGVAASVNDSNTVLAQKISQIWTGPKYAKGSIVSSNNTLRSFTSMTGTKQFEWIQVTGLDFRPNKIIVRRNQPDYHDLSVYDWFTRQAAPSTNVIFGENYNYMMKYTGWYGLYVYEYTSANRPGAEAYVNDSGFLLPVTTGNAPYIWEAFQVQ